MSADLSVILPAYHAAPFIEERLRLLHGQLEALGVAHEIVVVDDASGDDTAARAEALGLPGCTVLRSPQNEGKYGAIARGVEAASGRCVLFTDADVPFDLGVVRVMRDLVCEQGFHLAIGDRSLPDSRYAEAMSPLRRVASQAFTFFVRIFVTSGLYDTQCGIKAIRGDVAKRLFPLLGERGFAGDVELLYVALKYNLAIRRVPVRLRYQGPSSVRVLRHGVPMALATLRMRRRHRAGAYENAELRKLAAIDYPDAAG